MAGRPSAAAEKAVKWLAAELAAGRTRTPAEVAGRHGLSVSQARRICARAGLPPLPVGRPPAPAELEPASKRHLRYHDADPGL